MPLPTFERLSVLLALGASGALGACHDWNKYDPTDETSASTGTGADASTSASTSASASATSGTGGGGTGGSGGIGGCGEAGGSGGAVAVCSPKITDSFDSAPLGAQWTMNAPLDGKITIAKGELVLALPSTAQTVAEITSTVLVDLTECRSFVKLTRLPEMASKGLAVFSLAQNNNNFFTLLETNGHLEMKGKLAGVPITVSKSTTPYDPSCHAYLGISRIGGKIRWETSPDGQAWSTLATSSAPLSSSMFYIKLNATTYVGNEMFAPGETHFDNVNLAP
jgi:hypothetical protein